MTRNATLVASTLVAALVATPALAIPQGQLGSKMPSGGLQHPKMPNGALGTYPGTIKFPGQGPKFPKIPGPGPVGGPIKFPGGYKPAGYGWGYGAAALGGLAVGAIAASAASAGTVAVDGECWIERRRAVDEDGNLYVRRVRICE